MHPNPLLEPLEQRSLLSGVTLITHGQGGSAKGDVAMVANLIAQRAGGASQYVMKVAQSGTSLAVTSFTRDAGSPDPNTTSSGEIVIKVDWSDVSSSSTADIAAAVGEYLLNQAPTGHKLIEQEIALAGPSRGASVMSTLAAVLGKRGVWVDQVTYLDPVPIPFYDPAMTVTQNVIFSDNYYRNDGNPLNADFDGQPVDGSHNNRLDIVQNNHSIDAHSSVAAYYIATIDPTMPIVEPAKKIWFEGKGNQRETNGFYYSRLAGGPRPTKGLAPDHGGRAIRQAVKRSGSQWSNVDDLSLRSGSTVTAGKPMSVSMLHDDADSTHSVAVYLDQDRNPYNGSASRVAGKNLTKSGTGKVTLTGSTVEAAPGSYYVFAQTRDKGGHVRYSYLNRKITLTAPRSEDLFASLDNGALTVRGTVNADRISLTSTGASIIATRGDFSQRFNFSDVKSITVDAGAGDDYITVGANVPGSVLLGGKGRDLIYGGSNNDTLAGGANPDKLFGGPGADRLIGSGGRDTAEKDNADSRSSIEVLV